MSFFNRFLTNQPVGAVVPQVDRNAAGQLPVDAFDRLAESGNFLEADFLQLGVDELSRISVEEADVRSALVFRGQLPVSRDPRLAANLNFASLGLHRQALFGRLSGYRAPLAVVVSAGRKLLQLAVLPGLSTAEG